MKKHPVIALAMALATLCATPLAHAAMYHPAAPEIDPSVGVGALALLAGGLVVLRARFRR